MMYHEYQQLSKRDKEKIIKRFNNLSRLAYGKASKWLKLLRKGILIPVQDGDTFYKRNMQLSIDFLKEIMYSIIKVKQGNKIKFRQGVRNETNKTNSIHTDTN